MAQVDYSSYTSTESSGLFRDGLRNWAKNLRAFVTLLQTDHNALDTTVSGKISSTWAANVDADGNRLTGLPTGTPSAASDAASKQYVDDSVTAGGDPAQSQSSNYKHSKLRMHFFAGF